MFSSSAYDPAALAGVEANTGTMARDNIRARTRIPLAFMKVLAAEETILNRYPRSLLSLGLL
jgi:hypothetical protein